MQPPTLPQMTCPLLPKFDLKDWPSVQQIFEPLPSWPFQQAWQTTPSPEFRPAFSKVGYWKDALVVYAELGDRDIFNPVTQFNELAFQKGDVFEIFLRPENQKAYYEFHITPHNQKLQLRFPYAYFLSEQSEKKADMKQIVDSCKVDRPLFESHIQICAKEEKWRVTVAIPFASVAENGPSPRWRLSTSRYDYTRGEAQPVLSSTSPHAVCSYHRQEEWGFLQLA